MNDKNAPAEGAIANEADTENSQSTPDEQDLLEEMRRQLSQLMADNGVDGEPAKKRPAPEVDILFSHAPFHEQIEMQLALLTQAVARCMLHASGDFPELSEEPVSRTTRRSFHDHQLASRPAGTAAARSAQLHDAARLADASARLVSGYAKFRSHVDQRFSLRHTASHGKAGKKVRISSLTHRFTAARDEAIPEVGPLKAQVFRDLQPQTNT